MNRTLPFFNRLQFSPETEIRFQNDYFEKTISTSRLAIFLGLLLVAAFGFLDKITAPYSYSLIWVIRFGIVVPLLAFILFLTYLPNLMRWMQWAIAGGVLVSTLGITAMGTVTRPSEAAFSTYYVGVLLALTVGYTFTRLRFWYATAVGLVTLAVYEFAALGLQGVMAAPMGVEIFYNNNFFLVSANLIGMFASYFMERYARIDYLQRCQIEEEKAKSENMLQQEAAKALRASEERFRSLVEVSSDGVVIVNREGRFVYTSPSYGQLSGYSSEELIGESIFKVVAQDDVEHVASVFAALLQNPDQTAFAEYCHLRKDGAIRFVEASGKILPDGNAVAYLRDITERKRTEENLRLAKRRFQAVFEQPLLSVRIYAPDGKLIEWNAATEQMVSATSEQMQSFANTYNLLNDPDAHRLGFLPDIQRAFHGEAVNFPPLQRTFLTGEQNWVANYLYPVKDDNGEVYEIVSISQDVTVQQEAEQKLRRLNEELEQRVEERTAESKRLAAIIEAMPDYVGIADLQGNSLYVNRAGRQMMGKPEKDTAPWNVVQCYFPEDGERLQPMLAAMQSGESWAGELDLRHLEGRRIPTDHVVFPLHNTDGQIESYAAVIRDITERKRAEEEIHRAKETADEARVVAEAANKAKSTFLANMSHEIRTPMNAVIGMTGLLLNTPLNEKQRDFVETIRTSGDALLTIINDILDFSKIEAGKMDLVQRPLDLRACIESALDLLAPRAAEKGLELAYVMEDNVPAGILGDDTRLRQVLVNLIGNAIKFTERGEVVVSVSSKQLSGSSKNSSSADFSRFTLQFSVKDTGIGIDPAKLDRLFQSFTQLDSSATREYGGTGLGLAISKRLAELMGGTMWAESNGPGQGSTFHFTLQAPPAPAPIRSHLNTRQPVLMGKRILIVDDNPTNRRILTLQTQTWGMEPVEAATPHEALDILRQDQPFDLALLDMHMPEMDGASLAAAMCAEHEQQGHHFPLVLLTSLGYETHPELEAVQCFSAYLTKPVKPSQLYDVLVSVLVDEEREARRAQSLEPITETNLSRLSEKLPLRILLAEDVVVNQKFALLALDEMGYTADVAANGLEALEALKRQPYDVILMDVQMPEMDGLTATRQIRDCFSADRQPRIIAMTANAMQGDRELCLEAGMDDYISKPVYLEELQAALERAGQWLKTKRREKMTSTPDLTEIPILDQAAFDKILKYAMSNDLISAYIEEANALVGSLQQAVARADAPTIRARAHALKGSSSYIGAQRVRALSHEMEQAGKTGLLTHTPDLLAQLLDAHQQTRKALMR